MKKEYYFILAVILALIIIFFIKLDNNKVCFQENCFNVRIADSEKEREQGLMFVKNLDNDEGMLFVFEKNEEHCFWMKNTLIPLDLIWVDDNLKVSDITENFMPCKNITCENICKKSKYVIEINSGMNKNILIGDKTIILF